MTEQPREERLRLIYEKAGPAIYLSHLDAMESWLKAIRRAGIPYAVSQGCHVRPKVSFSPPAPLGHVSRCEVLVIALREALDPSATHILLNQHLPQGFVITHAELLPQQVPTTVMGQHIRYRLHFSPDPAGEAVLRQVANLLADVTREFAIRQTRDLKRFTLGTAIERCQRLPTDPEGCPALELDLRQGSPGQPSISKIVTAISQDLGEARHHLTSIERVLFLDLPFPPPAYALPIQDQ
jgi:radical SAM-linked protein